MANLIVAPDVANPGHLQALRQFGHAVQQSVQRLGLHARCRLVARYHADTPSGTCVVPLASRLAGPRVPSAMTPALPGQYRGCPPGQEACHGHSPGPSSARLHALAGARLREVCPPAHACQNASLISSGPTRQQLFGSRAHAKPRGVPQFIHSSPSLDEQACHSPACRSDGIVQWGAIRNRTALPCVKSHQPVSLFDRAQHVRDRRSKTSRPGCRRSTCCEPNANGGTIRC